MKWNESYSVGVKKFDYQHKILIDLINRLEDAIKSGDSTEETFRVLEEVFDYTVFHFGDEEKKLKEYAFPGLKEQEDEHKIFLEKIRVFRKDLRIGDVLVSEKVDQFLLEWLLDHIIGKDKKYGVFLNSKGIQ
jgi:hemerythrin-like metal-binding protein